jgi:uncharacterized protein Smg (DUF494 family)
MSDQGSEGIRKLFELLADHLEAWLEGDDLALESLDQVLQESDMGSDELEAGVLALRAIAGRPAGAAVATLDEAPGRGAQRVMSPEERESLSPEAWGFLLALRQGGSLDPIQFERVLDRLASSGVRPVGVELAREVALRVALRGAGRAESFEEGAGDGELAH